MKTLMPKSSLKRMSRIEIWGSYVEKMLTEFYFFTHHILDHTSTVAFVQVRRQNNSQYITSVIWNWRLKVKTDKSHISIFFLSSQLTVCWVLSAGISSWRRLSSLQDKTLNLRPEDNKQDFPKHIQSKVRQTD